MSSRGDEVRKIRTVAVAFDPVCASPALLQAATEVAVSLGADLEALIIDDQDIARLCRLPFGRIVEPLSGKSVTFDDAAIRSRRSGPLARSRAVLRDLSERHRLTCSVRELPGVALADAASESSAELFVVASFHAKFGGALTIDPDARDIAARSAGSVLLASHLPVSTRKIVVVSDDSAAGQHAAAVAARLGGGTATTESLAVGDLSPAARAVPALVAQILEMSPSLVVVGLRDPSLSTALQEPSATRGFSLLTVR